MSFHLPDHRASSPSFTAIFFEELVEIGNGNQSIQKYVCRALIVSYSVY